MFEDDNGLNNLLLNTHHLTTNEQDSLYIIESLHKTNRKKFVDVLEPYFENTQNKGDSIKVISSFPMIIFVILL